MVAIGPKKVRDPTWLDNINTNNDTNTNTNIDTNTNINIDTNSNSKKGDVVINPFSFGFF